MALEASRSCDWSLPLRPQASRLQEMQLRENPNLDFVLPTSMFSCIAWHMARSLQCHYSCRMAVNKTNLTNNKTVSHGFFRTRGGTGWTSCLRSPCRSTDRLIDRSINRSSNPSMDWSIDHLKDCSLSITESYTLRYWGWVRKPALTNKFKLFPREALMHYAIIARKTMNV